VRCVRFARQRLEGLSPTPRRSRPTPRRDSQDGRRASFRPDVAFGPAAIDQHHGGGFLRLRDGDGGRSLADALASGDDEEGFEAGKRPRACASRTSAALAWQNSRSSTSGSG
jgi:hypothetical protein